jgi:hypothetical protein
LQLQLQLLQEAPKFGGGTPRHRLRFAYRLPAAEEVEGGLLRDEEARRVGCESAGVGHGGEVVTMLVVEAAG